MGFLLRFGVCARSRRIINTKSQNRGSTENKRASDSNCFSHYTSGVMPGGVLTYCVCQTVYCSPHTHTYKTLKRHCKLTSLALERTDLSAMQCQEVESQFTLCSCARIPPVVIALCVCVCRAAPVTLRCRRQNQYTSYLIMTGKTFANKSHRAGVLCT